MAFGHGAILHSPLDMATMWALGDYHRFATATVWELGPQLVAACGISPGQRVLDVAAGSGNVAIRAALAGACVVASDVTPENFDAGRRAAREAGVDLEWIEGDAQALPFGDAEFDVVTSCFGAMFAPDHDATARELLRVCRPGGVIGMMNFTPAGAGGDFFRVLGSFAPAPPPDARPPLSWGTEEYVRKLFGDRVRSLSATRHGTSNARRARGITSSCSNRRSGRWWRSTPTWTIARRGNSIGRSSSSSSGGTEGKAGACRSRTQYLLDRGPHQFDGECRSCQK